MVLITQVAWLQLRQWGKPLGTMEANPFYLKGNGAEEISWVLLIEKNVGVIYKCVLHSSSRSARKKIDVINTRKQTMSTALCISGVISKGGMCAKCVKYVTGQSFFCSCVSAAP